MSLRKNNAIKYALFTVAIQTGCHSPSVEAQLGNCALTVNDIIDTQTTHNNEHNWIKDKLADLEDRSYWNNIKIQGISEEVQTQDLSSYVRGLIKTMTPELKNIELFTDCIHRLPKPPYMPETISRDVILHIQFFHVKNQLMQKAPLQIYADLSQHILQKQRQLNNITKALHNDKIPYQWEALGHLPRLQKNLLSLPTRKAYRIYTHGASFWILHRMPLRHQKGKSYLQVTHCRNTPTLDLNRVNFKPEISQPTLPTPMAVSLQL